MSLLWDRKGEGEEVCLCFRCGMLMWEGDIRGDILGKAGVSGRETSGSSESTLNSGYRYQHLLGEV
jgi:hypothetical protein